MARKSGSLHCLGATRDGQRAKRGRLASSTCCARPSPATASPPPLARLPAWRAAAARARCCGHKLHLSSIQHVAMMRASNLLNGEYASSKHWLEESA